MNVYLTIPELRLIRKVFIEMNRFHNERLGLILNEIKNNNHKEHTCVGAKVADALIELGVDITE